MVNDNNNKLNKFTSCESCEHIGFDSNMLGYCNNPRSNNYRHLVVDDSGCLVKVCRCHNYRR